jgi:hypothetical protein
MSLSARAIALHGIGFVPRVLALAGFADVQTVPLQPVVRGTSMAGGATIRGKRRVLRPDPYLEQLQKQFEEDAQELQTASACIRAQRPAKRTRAHRENEFFSLLH